MNVASAEALVVHGGGLTPDGGLVERAVSRMDTAIDAWNSGVAPHMVVSGGYSFMLRTPPATTEAVVMKKYAVDEGVPADYVLTEDRSLDTIGNALFTKTDIVMPSSWDHLAVVTSQSHIFRTLEIFGHIFGKDFNIVGIPAPEAVTAKEKLWEHAGTLLTRRVFRGIKPGDHEAIQERLFKTVPGYSNATFLGLTKALTAEEIRFQFDKI